MYGISQNSDTKDYFIILQDEYCKKCGKQYTDINNKWCKSCNINCLKNNFTNWTSENEKIDNFIQKIQLKINNYDGIIEWILYNEFTNIKKIGTIYLAIWKNGPLKYEYSKHIYKRKYYKKVALKYLNNSYNKIYELLNEV
jgi:hypothetical protein